MDEEQGGGVIDLLNQITGADVTITTSGLLLVLVAMLLAPEPYRFLYSRAAFERLRKSRDYWRSRWEQIDAKTRD